MASRASIEMVRKHWLKLVVAAALVAAGCGEGIDGYEAGELSVEWEVAPDGCDQGGVTEVEMMAAGGDEVRVERFDCAGETGLMRDLEAGRKDVELVGIDDDGRRTHEAVDEVVVRPGVRTEVDELELMARPAVVELDWQYPEGVDCVGDEAGTVDVTVYAGGVDRVHRSEHGCRSENAEIEGLQSGNHLFRIRSRIEGRQLEGKIEETLKPGDESKLEMVLTEDES